MFGEKNIYGQINLKLDDKNRIILPKFTYRETGDSLVIVKNKESNSYDIYKTEVFDEKLQDQINYLEDKLKKTIDDKKREQIQKLLNELYDSILVKTTCDKQGRIVITSILDEGEKIDTVEAIGAYNHLMIRKPKQKSKRK